MNLHILRVTTKNVGKIKETDIRFDHPGVWEMSGRNGAGKSSNMLAIAYVLCGKSVIPGNVVRQGEDKAECRVEIGEFPNRIMYVAERIWKANGDSKSTLVSPAGLPCEPEQTVLNSIVGKLGFDPWRFASQKPKERRDELLKIVKLTIDKTEFERYAERLFPSAMADDPLSAINAVEAEIYDERENLSRDVKRAKATAERFTTYVETETVETAALVAEKDRREGINRANGSVRAKCGTLAGQLQELRSKQGATQGLFDDMGEKALELASLIGETCATVASKFAAVASEVAALESMQEMIYGDIGSGVELASDVSDKAVELGAKYNGVIREMRRLHETVTSLTANAVAIQAAYVQAQRESSALVDLDVTDIKSQIDNADETNRLAAVYQQRLEADRDHEALQTKWEALSVRINGLRSLKVHMLAAAEFPVSGMGFGENDITFNDIPFEQACTSEKLKIAFGVGMAINPGLRFILCQNASLLDADSVALVDSICRERDFVALLEMVGYEIIGSGWMIEDGRVAA